MIVYLAGVGIAKSMLRDRVLIRKAKRGERKAFGLIYEKYRDTLLTVAMSLSADPELAQDAVQDVFVKFVESLDGFELRGRLKGYLATCVANRVRDRFRQMAHDNCVEQDGRDFSQGRPLDLAVQMLNKSDLLQVAEIGEPSPAEPPMRGYTLRCTLLTRRGDTTGESRWDIQVRRRTPARWRIGKLSPKNPEE